MKSEITWNGIIITLDISRSLTPGEAFMHGMRKVTTRKEIDTKWFGSTRSRLSIMAMISKIVQTGIIRLR